MKKLELTEAQGTLAAFVRETQDESLILTSKGRPVAALVPIRGGDLESASLSLNPKFLAIIERSRASLEANGGIPLEEMRQRLGLPPNVQRKKRATKARAAVATARR